MKSFPAALRDQIGKGGFAVVFRDPRSPTTTCIKQFKQPVDGEAASRLRHLAEMELWARPSEISELKATFSWPLELFGDDNRILGYTMPLAPADAFITLRAAGREATRLLEISYLTVKDYFRRGAITSTAPDFSFSDRIDLSLSVCDAIMLLHRHGLVFRDISARNIAARLTTPRSAFILDADSIVDVTSAGLHPVNSPGWQVNPAHDPLQTDRAKLSMLVLRLLVEDNDARPPLGLGPLQSRGLHQLALAIGRCYEEATEESITSMIDELRRARTTESTRAAWTKATSAGWAAHVIRERLGATSEVDRRLLTMAEQHSAAERDIESADVPTQKKLLARLMRNSRFEIDLPSGVGVGPAPRTEEELIQLVFDAQFADIARHLSITGLPSLVRHPLMAHIADRAAFEADRPRVTHETKPGIATIHIEWPHSYHCNAIEISLGSATTEVVKRDTSRARVTREVRLAGGGDVSVGLRTGVITPQGQVFLSRSRLVTTTIPIPPVPAPVRPASSRSNGPRPMVDMSAATIVDLEEEARRREEEEKAAIKRRRKIVAAVISVLVVGTAGWTIFWPDDEPENPPSTIRLIRY